MLATAVAASHMGSCHSLGTVLACSGSAGAPAGLALPVPEPADEAAGAAWPTSGAGRVLAVGLTSALDWEALVEPTSPPGREVEPTREALVKPTSSPGREALDAEPPSPPGGALVVETFSPLGREALAAEPTSPLGRALVVETFSPLGREALVAELTSPLGVVVEPLGWVALLDGPTPGRPAPVDPSTGRLACPAPAVGFGELLEGLTSSGRVRAGAVFAEREVGSVRVRWGLEAAVRLEGRV